MDSSALAAAGSGERPDVPPPARQAGRGGLPPPAARVAPGPLDPGRVPAHVLGAEVEVDRPVQGRVAARRPFRAHLAQPRAWGYRYNVADELNAAAGLGVPHLFESWAIFGPDNVPGAPRSYYTYNAGVVPLVMDYWISFVRTLDPSALCGGDWEPWEEEDGGRGRQKEGGKQEV